MPKCESVILARLYVFMIFIQDLHAYHGNKEHAVVTSLRAFYGGRNFILPRLDLGLDITRYRMETLLFKFFVIALMDYSWGCPLQWLISGVT